MCNFSITFQGSAQDLANKLRTEITKRGGTFDGDATRGTFSIPTPIGKISGSYTISGQALDVTIFNKPMLVSCKTIQDYVEEYIG